MDVKERFLRYVTFHTTSDEESGTVPSTPGQLVLGKALAEELAELGLSHVEQDENGYVYGVLPASPGCEALPALGFIAHMDTAPGVSGENVKPRCLRYEGGDIRLGNGEALLLKDFPQLANYVGQELIVTDGSTLLGADDKAGVAEIVTMAQHFLDHPELPHGDIRIAFTPDEEVGGGPDHFDVAKFGTAFGYTVDGGVVGSINFENFNAASALVVVHGAAIHPGSSKNKMKNASLMAMEFNALLPAGEVPALTEGYEGFNHLTNMQGDVERAELHYIIRDHDKQKFEHKKARFEKIAAYLNDKYGEGTFELTLRDTYYNMRQMIEPRMEIIDIIKEVMTDMGVTPSIEPIRGGTDGCRLSFMGLPCPNLCSGGHNAHGKYEYISVQSLKACADILIGIAQKVAK